MAIHSDHNRKRKGLTQEDLPNIPSASHSRAAEGCAEFQCILPRPTLISMPVPSLSWISSLEGPLLPHSPQGLTLCWVLYAQEDLFFLAFEKTQPQSPASPARCWELQSPDFYVHFSFYCFACWVLGQQPYDLGLPSSQSQREACAWAFPQAGPEMASRSGVDSHQWCTVLRGNLWC